MNATEQLETLSNKIADAIVALVKAKDGPVTLLQIEREVPGFAANGEPTCDFTLHWAGDDALVWGDMSAAGAEALIKVIYGKRLAIQLVTAMPYLLDGGECYLDREDWLAIMLIPARAANVSTPRLLACLSPQSLKEILARPASDEGSKLRQLSPRPMRFEADYFSLGDPRSPFTALLVRADAA